MSLYKYVSKIEIKLCAAIMTDLMSAIRELKIPLDRFVVGIFLLGGFFGVIFSIACRELCEFYYFFYKSDILSYALGLQAKMGLFGLFLAILSKNLIFVTILILGPYIIAQSSIKENRNPEHFLKLFTTFSIFIYGFFPYGLFIGYLHLKYSLSYLLNWMLYFMPHGILETIIILSAGSTGMIMNKNISKKGIKQKLSIEEALKKLIIVTSLLSVTASIEIFISPLFLYFF